MLFVDADYFIGIYSKKDLLHRKCLSLAQSIQEGLLTSFEAVNEAATKLSYFVDKKIALTFIDDLIKEKITVVYPEFPLVQDAVKIFRGQTSKKASLTDCINMAIAKDKRIDTFLSFDKIYERNRFKLYGQ